MTKTGSVDVRNAVRQWLTTAWSPDLTVREWWARLAESGWGYPTWPTEWFGKGMSDLQAKAVSDELAVAGVLGPPSGAGVAMAAPVLFAHGTDEQKQLWLPALARGEENWCQFFSEPGAGSDLASIATGASRDGDEWVINGQKIWNSGTLDADRGLLVVRTDPEMPKHRGMSFFVIDVDQPGVEIRPIRQMNWRAEFNEAFFTDARVSDAAMVGGLNNGFRVAMTTLSSERSNFAGGGEYLLATAVPGKKAGNLDRTVSEVVEKFASEFVDGANTPPVSTPEDLILLARAYGRLDDPLIRDRIAAIYATSEALRFTGLRAQASAEAGRKPGQETSIGYLGAVRVLRLVRDLTAEIAGPASMLRGDAEGDISDVVMTIVTVPCHGIQGGSEQIQMNIIGERILGLPKEPQVDRDIPFRAIATLKRL